MKLHGHTRLELTDIHTGAVEVVEKDNIITNAVGGDLQRLRRQPEQGDAALARPAG